MQNEKYARKQREIWCGTKGSQGLCASIRMPQGSHSLIEEGEGGWRTYILSLSLSLPKEWMTGFADNDDCGDDHEGGAMVATAMVFRIVVDDIEGQIIWIDRLFAIEDSSVTYFFSLAFSY